MTDPTSLATLAALALIDSTSFGTLLIPIWLLMTPGRLRTARVLTFLLVVTAAYFAIGVALLFGATALLDAVGGLADSRAFLMGQLAVGIALVVVSQRMDCKKARERTARRAAAGEGRLSRWRAQAMGSDSSGGGSLATLVGLALTTVLIEVVTMLPYLAAIGIITTRGPGWPGDGVLLAGYCLVMIVPALALTAGRLFASSALEQPLTRLDRWLTARAQSTTAWVIGIVGAILALRAVFQLGWFGG